VNVDGTKHDCPNITAAGTPFVKKPAAAAPAPSGTKDTLYDECLILLDNMASNILTIKAKLAEMQKR
jgi:hypothetical protein